MHILNGAGSQLAHKATVAAGYHVVYPPIAINSGEVILRVDLGRHIATAHLAVPESEDVASLTMETTAEQNRPVCIHIPSDRLRSYGIVELRFDDR